MFHMLSCFDLNAGVTIEEFAESNNLFLIRMQELGLVQSISPIGRRNRHPVMDTDKERNQEYFFTMSFLNEKQCNDAVECIYSANEPEESIHGSISSKVKNQIFVCWEDI